MSPHVEYVTGDLVAQDVEVIVNAWNRNVIPWWLLLPQGVSGAIKRAAGYAPFRELAKMRAIPAGGAVLTQAGRLPFKGIIHVAGLTLLLRSSEDVVRRCVRSALGLAREHEFRSVAMPLIGAGTGGLRPDRVVEIIANEASKSIFEGRLVIVRFPAAG